LRKLTSSLISTNDVHQVGDSAPQFASVAAGVLKMQFMILFTRHPDKAETPAPADLREAEFEKVRGLYTDGLVQQIWLRGDAGLKNLYR
jgi:hypothetical protein